MEMFCCQLKFCDEICFLGKQDVIEELFFFIDFFLMFLVSESFGLVVLEVMVCEVLVVLFNVGGIFEVNIYGEIGFLVDVGDIDVMVKYVIEILKDEDMLV